MTDHNHPAKPFAGEHLSPENMPATRPVPPSPVPEEGEREPCNMCAGRGRVDDGYTNFATCPQCEGAGHVPARPAPAEEDEGRTERMRFVAENAQIDPPALDADAPRVESIEVRQWDGTAEGLRALADWAGNDPTGEPQFSWITADPDAAWTDPMLGNAAIEPDDLFAKVDGWVIPARSPAPVEVEEPTADALSIVAARDFRPGDMILMGCVPRLKWVKLGPGKVTDSGKRYIVRRPVPAPVESGETVASVLETLRARITGLLNGLPSVARQDASMLPEALGLISAFIDRYPAVPAPVEKTTGGGREVTLTAEQSDNAAQALHQLLRIRAHGASGLWSGEDCAIAAIAALEGEDAARELAIRRTTGEHR